MPKKMDHPFKLANAIRRNLAKTLIEEKEIYRQHEEISHYSYKLERSSTQLDEARLQLKALIKEFKNKIEKEEQKSRELTATYYLLAYNFLTDFSSEQTEDLFASLRKQIKVFIYSSFTKKMAFCLESPAFQELFKKTENLELNFWYQERIAHAALLMQEFLLEAYGLKVEYESIPETEMELFDCIIDSTSNQMGFLDLDKYMNRLSGAAEDTITDFNAYNSNAQFRRKYFEFSFKFSRYIGEQMANIAQGVGLFELSDLFSLHAERLKIQVKLSAIKEKMGYLFSILPMNVPSKEEKAPFWEKLIHHAHKAIIELSEGEAPLFKIEQDWINHIMEKDDPTADRNVHILCDILKLHTKFIKGQIKLVELAGNYEHFSFMDQYYSDIKPTLVRDTYEELKDSNKEMAADIKIMEKSPDQLFKLIKQKEGSMYGFHLYSSHQDQMDGNPLDSFPADLDDFFDEEEP